MSEDVMQEFQNHKPTYKVDGEGHFYCDGVRVMPSQLTAKEIAQYIPVAFQDRYYKAIGKKVNEVKSNDGKK